MKVIMKSSSASSIKKAQEELEKCLTVLSVGHYNISVLAIPDL